MRGTKGGHPFKLRETKWESPSGSRRKNYPYSWTVQTMPCIWPRSRAKTRWYTISPNQDTTSFPSTIKNSLKKPVLLQIECFYSIGGFLLWIRSFSKSSLSLAIEKIIIYLFFVGLSMFWLFSTDG